ncbi:MAG: helix-turn-helix domain-containing protein [Aeromicrobium sp.]|uniref:excisionase family DNA-binding protein n=1 Tax=Aeromicrobium sp. TaxID=1871063 RepID=UPI0039E47161
MITDVLTVAEAAKALGISRRAVIRRIHAGSISAEKLSAGTTAPFLIHVTEVERVRADQAAHKQPDEAER